MTKYCITFAGAVGSSKTPIANYLSINLGLPVLNNDAIRSEVTEDLGHFDETEYLKRRDERINAVLNTGESFIYDASVDRAWKDRGGILSKNGFASFIISLDLSRDKLYELFTQKGYEQTNNINNWIKDHDNFLKDYSSIVNLHIDDNSFEKRLELSLKAVQGWLKNA